MCRSHRISVVASVSHQFRFAGLCCGPCSSPQAVSCQVSSQKPCYQASSPLSNEKLSLSCSCRHMLPPCVWHTAAWWLYILSIGNVMEEPLSKWWRSLCYWKWERLDIVGPSSSHLWLTSTLNYCFKFWVGNCLTGLAGAEGETDSH